MSLSLQNLFTNSPSRFNLYFTATTTFKTPTLSVPITSRHLTTPPHLHNLHHKSLIPHTHSSGSFKTHHFRLRVYESQGAIHKNDTNSFNFDSFLSIAELLCLISSVAIGFWGWKKALFVELGNRVLVWGVVLLAGGVAIGSWIRRRQWRRVCRETVKGGVEVNLLERIEKLEDDLRSSATIIRVLSRQLEKLGIRFRVTRKTLKEPIAETAALAQKNSEATRALAQQEDILEKELGEIQKVLLAMQEQQRKQLELILAIGKAGKLWESRREHNQEEDTTDTHNLAVEGFKQKETHQI